MADLNPATMSYYSGKDISDLLGPYYEYTKGFHQLELKNCYLYLTQGLKVSPSFFVHNERINLPAVELYDLKAGAKQGVRFGFLIRSPLPCVYNRNYLLFYRKSIDLKDLMSKGVEAKRNYHINDLLFFTIEDEAILISNIENTPFVQSLET